MPVVEIKWLAGRSREVKEKIASVIEETMIAEAKCKPGDTHVVFHDVDRSNWAMGGKLKDK